MPKLVENMENLYYGIFSERSIITKNSTNMNVRKLHNDKFDSKKAAKVGLDASLKASIVPDDAIIDLRNLVRDYYYFKDLQSAIVLKLHAELNLNLF